jgi:hypothetical protein
MKRLLPAFLTTLAFLLGTDVGKKEIAALRAAKASR